MQKSALRTPSQDTPASPIHDQKPIYNIIVIRHGKCVHRIDSGVLITVYTIADKLIVSTGCAIFVIIALKRKHPDVDDAAVESGEHPHAGKLSIHMYTYVV